MTNEDIIRMAHEAGLHIATDHDWMPIIALAYAQKFAELVRADERDACAKRLDAVGCDHCAENIRLRGRE
jgi:hypothetical protein